MNFRIDKSDLMSLLFKTQNIVEKRNTMPILVNVLFETKDNVLNVYATDLEVSLTDQVAVEVKTPGKVAVGAKNLYDIVKDLEEGMIELTKKSNNWLEIRQFKNIYNIVGVSADEYPVFPTYTTKNFVKIPAETFKDMLEKTIYSVSTDETRYHLNGVYFERVQGADGANLRMVATDGHRLSMVDRKINLTNQEFDLKGVIIPKKGLNEIRKIIDSSTNTIELAIEGSQLIVKQAHTTLMIRLIEGKYPNYQQLIPQGAKSLLQIPREKFLSSLKRISIVSNQKSKGITLSLHGGSMEITANNPEVGDGKEELEVKYSGEDIKISFNAKYLIDILNTVSDDTISIGLNGQLSPGLVTPEHDQNYKCVIMPMRL